MYCTESNSIDAFMPENSAHVYILLFSDAVACNTVCIASYLGTTGAISSPKSLGWLLSNHE